MPRFNRCPNPALKNNVTGWFVDRGVRAALTGMSRATGWVFQGNGYAVGPDTAAAAGTTWTVSCEVRNSVTGPVGISMDFESSTGAFLQNFAQEVSVAAGVPTRISVTATAPASSATVVPVCSTFPANANCDITSFLVEQAPAPAGSYFDGDTSGASWDGTNGNSTSTLPDAAPTVDAGADVAAHPSGTVFTRTAGETNGGAAITARAWTIVSGPTGAGTTIGTAAALTWTPTVAGVYVLRYSATNSVGTGTDDVQVTVTAPAGGGAGRRGFFMIFR